MLDQVKKAIGKDFGSWLRHLTLLEIMATLKMTR